jgi:hypothetical protein
MKSLIVYYSHYGNTAYVADKFLEVLRKYGDVDIFELAYAGGKKSLPTRILYRIIPSLVHLAPVPLDLKNIDVLCLGISILGGYPSSAMLKYLRLFKNLDDKKVICLYVYALEPSAWHCCRYVEKILQKRGHPKIINVYIPWPKMYNKQFLDKVIKEALDKTLQPA